MPLWAYLGVPGRIHCLKLIQGPQSARKNHPHSTQRSLPKRAQRAPKGPLVPGPWPLALWSLGPVVPWPPTGPSQTAHGALSGPRQAPPKRPMGPLGPPSFATERLHNGARVRRSESATERQYDGATLFGSAGMRASVKNDPKIILKVFRTYVKCIKQKYI